VVREQAEWRRTKDPATALLLYYLPDLFFGVKICTIVKFLETNSMVFFFWAKDLKIFFKKSRKIGIFLYMVSTR
jgi:hypothetical protein